MNHFHVTSYIKHTISQLPICTAVVYTDSQFLGGATNNYKKKKPTKKNKQKKKYNPTKYKLPELWEFTKMLSLLKAKRSSLQRYFFRFAKQHSHDCRKPLSSSGGGQMRGRRLRSSGRECRRRRRSRPTVLVLPPGNASSSSPLNQRARVCGSCCRRQNRPLLEASQTVTQKHVTLGPSPILPPSALKPAAAVFNGAA